MVADLAARVGNGAIHLTWTGPDKDAEGKPLTELVAFRVERAEEPFLRFDPAVPDPPEAAPAFRTIGKVAAGPEDQRGYAFDDRGGIEGLERGRRYRYRVVPLARREREGGPSNEAAADYAVPPGAPLGLIVEAGEGVVRLRWDAPPAQADGAPLPGPVRYNVYRREPEGSFGDPLNPAPVVETRFADRAVVNDRPYRYIVRAVDSRRPPWHEGPATSEAEAMPRKLTPPSIPQGLVAVPGRDAVDLIWDPNPEADLLGYRVYRAEGGLPSFQRLTTDPIPGTTFTDRPVGAGRTYRYRVTAVDASLARNESPPSVVATAAIPGP
jgi:hypothetical protein